ncbi:MAG: serine/threonine-protein phosphatase [Anaerolineaceae bacterium]|nr:serine/threonine-protein phosphatase [Anaerolineaceae bacterium]
MIRIEKSHLQTAASTHPGMTGKNNEDRYAITAYVLEKKNLTPVLLAVLSDGIGGHRAGEVAAEMIVDSISEKVAQSNGKEPLKTLHYAIQTASNQVLEESNDGSARKGMGATVCCALIINNRLYTATVGDSRIYLISDGIIRQISIDHTWIQEALETGLLTPEQAVGHPNAHVIRRYVGSPSPPEVDFRLRLDLQENDAQSIANQGFPLKEGDMLLLCSDGLTDLVVDQEILTVLQANDLEIALQILEDMANERGGHDNITMTAVFVPQGAIVTEKEKKPVSKRLMIVGCSALLLTAILILASIFGFGLLSLKSSWPWKASTPTIEFLEESEKIIATSVPEGFGGEIEVQVTEGTKKLENTLPPPPTNTVSVIQGVDPAVSSTPWPTDTQTATPQSTEEENQN